MCDIGLDVIAPVVVSMLFCERCDLATKSFGLPIGMVIGRSGLGVIRLVIELLQPTALRPEFTR